MDAVEVSGLLAIIGAQSKPLRLDLALKVNRQIYEATIIAATEGWVLDLRDDKETPLPGSGDVFPSQEGAIVCAMLQSLEASRQQPLPRRS
ncbi:MAG: hypothetical protein JOZ41_04305 [Chloroflexi bacterium]|nr:hypothetical protein [Chloroflexota bacterium]